MFYVIKCNLSEMPLYNSNESTVLKIQWFAGDDTMALSDTAALVSSASSEIYEADGEIAIPIGYCFVSSV